jgi:hypothetical protein
MAATARDLAHPASRARQPSSTVVGVAGAVTVVMLWHMHEVATVRPGPIHTAIDVGVMTAAMMTLLIGGSARLVAERALPERRWRAVGEHTLGFATTWFACGVIASGLVQTVQTALSPPIVFGTLLAVAGVWQLSDRRRRVLSRCGHLPVAPLRGWRSSSGNLRAGHRDAISCMPGAGVPMLAMAAAPGVVAMSIVLAAHVSEWVPGHQRFEEVRARRPASAYLALAVANLVFVIAR